MGDYVRGLTYTRGTTQFTRALAEGHEASYDALGHAVADLQAVAVDPYRRRITALVAAAAAHFGARAAANGTGALLNSLHPQVQWDGRVLSVAANADRDVELDGRALVLRPLVFAFKPGFSGDMFADMVELYFPATDAVLERDPRGEVPNPALTTLLGTTRAAVLAAIIRTPAVTTGQLATALGLSAASASRHATVLRDAGLITTFRNGMTVHHHPTRLGAELVEHPDAGAAGPALR